MVDTDSKYRWTEFVWYLLAKNMKVKHTDLIKYKYTRIGNIIAELG